MKESAIILDAVYKRIYNEDIKANSFQDRLMAQKTAYILREIGMNIGDYGYRWYKHGPYSQTVQDDILFLTSKFYEVREEVERIEFTEAGENFINRFKEILGACSSYNIPSWLEAVASVHYLQKYMVSVPTKEKVISKLQELKPHLNNFLANQKAYETVKKYMI